MTNITEPEIKVGRGKSNLIFFQDHTRGSTRRAHSIRDGLHEPPRRISLKFRHSNKIHGGVDPHIRRLAYARPFNDWGRSWRPMGDMISLITNTKKKEEEKKIRLLQTEGQAELRRTVDHREAT